MMMRSLPTGFGFFFKGAKALYCVTISRNKFTKPSLQTLTYCHFRAIHIKPTVVSDVTQDLDIDELYSQFKKHAGAKRTCPQIKDMVDKKVEEKCSAALQSLSTEETRKLEVIRLEYDFLFSEGNEIKPPGEVSSRVWLEALTFSTIEERLRCYLSHGSTMCLNQTGEHTQDNPDGEVTYNSLFDSHQEAAHKRWMNHRVAQAITHEPPLLLDLGFGDDMSPLQLDETAKQVWLSYCRNRENFNPFNLILTSCHLSNPIYRYMQLFHAIEEPHLLTTVRKESPTELYDPTEIVYLTSKAKADVQSFNPNTIYVLGAYSNNFGDVKFRCVARSKELKIRSQRLPIDEHIRWPKAPKNLDLQDMISVLSMLKSGGTWKEAFEHILKHGSSIPDWIKEGKQDNNAAMSKQQKYVDKKSITRKRKQR